MSVQVIDPTWFDKGQTNITMKNPPLFPWKGKTFAQVTTFLQRNKNTNTSVANTLLPNPVTRQYRREIASTPTRDPTNCNERVSVRIDELNRPGGSLVLPLNTLTPGIPGVVDPLIPNDKTHLSIACETCNKNADNCLTSSSNASNVCFTDETNARRRCRSAGMVKRQYKVANNNDNAYFTDSKQYLTSRNRLFSQNQYNYLRTGSSVTVPGTPLALNNTYSANGLSHCPQYTIKSVQGNNQFGYTWIDGTSITVGPIPDGSYTIESFNAIIIQNMTNYGYYYRNKVDSTYRYLIQFTYDTLKGRVILQLLPPNLFASGYTAGPGAWSNTIINATYTPTVTFLNNGLPEALGFLYGTSLPAQQTGQSGGFAITAPNAPLLLPNYVSVIYKPSNPRFAQQGGVSSSTYAARIKWETVNTTAAATGQPNFGQEVANELAYGTPFVGYTIKDKIGFPNTKAPVIMPSGEVRCCQTFIYR